MIKQQQENFPHMATGLPPFPLILEAMVVFARIMQCGQRRQAKDLSGSEIGQTSGSGQPPPDDICFQQCLHYCRNLQTVMGQGMQNGRDAILSFSPIIFGFVLHALMSRQKVARPDNGEKLEDLSPLSCKIHIQVVIMAIQTLYGVLNMIQFRKEVNIKTIRICPLPQWGR
jgi:hypothetical protein